jgi:hypothetical protein
MAAIRGTAVNVICCAPGSRLKADLTREILNAQRQQSQYSYDNPKMLNPIVNRALNQPPSPMK